MKILNLIKMQYILAYWVTKVKKNDNTWCY